jgi:phenylpyruvate tautomerase PptA (4-oxalocrotonate tautomerase family)
MPFIDCKISEKLTDEQKETIKSQFGKAISVMNKTESYLMVGISDGYSLYFGGKPLANGAYVNVSVFGKVKPECSEKMTKAVCDIFKDNLNIDGDKVYVTYSGVENWGWNGGNF